MQRLLALKLLMIALVAGALLVALAMVESSIRERAAYREQAVREIGELYSGQQRLAGPILTIPVRERYLETETSADGKQVRKVERVEQRDVTVFPDALNLTGALNTHSRYLGLHKVQVYELQGALESRFSWPAEAALRTRRDSRIEWGEPALSFAVSDVRGLAAAPTLKVDGQERALQQGTRVGKLASGIHAVLEVPAATDKPLQVRLDFVLAGSQAFDFIPLGKVTDVKLTSNWPHPQFGGRFVPRQRQISQQGFDAHWNISALATAARTQIMDVPGGADSIAVSLVEPVSLYLQAERAVKYGVLFIALTFGAFFLFETLKRLRLHVIQYALSGAALALFFLLLIALSEHIAFHWAYLASASACVLLYAVYLSAVLRSVRRGLAFAGGLAVLYAVLFGLLQSEQNAFVLGALFLFAVLAATMIGTRRVDWHALGSADAKEATPGS
jgi:inner membrane protein